MKLHLLKASGRLDAFEETLVSAFNEVVEKAQEKISLPKIDVLMADNPGNAIPETGVGGFATNAHLMYVNIDPESPHFKMHVKEEIVSTVAHELHHCVRWNTVGYGKTLLEAMVSEGLADHFDIELHNQDPRPWSVALTETQLSELLKKAALEFDNAKYDHAAWFFGSEEKGIPRWTGYSIGFQLVGDHMKRTGKTAAELVAITASDFI